MSFCKLLIIVASVAFSVSALAAPGPDVAEARAEAAAHTGDGTFYTRKSRDWYSLFEQSNVLTFFQRVWVLAASQTQSTTWLSQLATISTTPSRTCHYSTPSVASTDTVNF